MFLQITKSILHITVFTLLAACGSTEPPADIAEQILSDSGVTFSAIILSDGLTVQGPNTVFLNVSNESGPIANATITAIPTMPGHGGHGTSEAPIVVGFDNGDYEITNLIFTMPGTWQIELLAQFVDGSKASVNLYYTVE